MLLTLNHRIREEVYGKIRHYGKVNYLWHGAKRVPVAFVPFGVSAVNFLGLSKLVANILRDTGMFQDPETTKAGTPRSPARQAAPPARFQSLKWASSSRCHGISGVYGNGDAPRMLES